MSAVRLTTRFNQVVQVDFFFIFQLTILHVLDEATRWTAVRAVPSREDGDVLPVFEDMWIAIFGPPRILIIDQEGAFARDAGMA
eukprot:1419461-Pyramimonas_sp.AAC.1